MFFVGKEPVQAPENVYPLQQPKLVLSFKAPCLPGVSLHSKS